VRIPQWLTLAIALIVMLFGLYRMKLAFAKPPVAEEGEPVRPRSGFYGMSKHAHLAIGTIYLLLGCGLIATSFGWNPFGGSIGPKTEVPAKDKAPTSTGMPIDHLPPPK
jgi:hypothetical protein